MDLLRVPDEKPHHLHFNFPHINSHESSIRRQIGTNTLASVAAAAAVFRLRLSAVSLFPPLSAPFPSPAPFYFLLINSLFPGLYCSSVSHLAVVSPRASELYCNHSCTFCRLLRYSTATKLFWGRWAWRALAFKGFYSSTVKTRLLDFHCDVRTVRLGSSPSGSALKSSVNPVYSCAFSVPISPVTGQIIFILLRNHNNHHYETVG